MQPCLFPKVLYTYTSTSQQWFFVLLQIVIGSQPYQGIQEALYILAPTRSFRNTIFIKNMYSQDSILTYCCPSSIDSFTSLKELCTAVSLKMTLDSCQRYAALPYIRGPYKNDATLCKERCDFMLGMSYSRKKIVLHKACIGGFENKCQRPCWNLFAGYMFKSWLCCISSHGFKSLSGRVPKPWENLFVWFCSELDAKAEEQCANSIEEIDCVYGFAHEEYIYIGFVTSKNEVFKPSHRQKSCTHIVPCSEKIRGDPWEKYIFHHHRWGFCYQWPPPSVN